MNVKRNAESNRYCGPAALSLLTGRHVDECTAQLRANRASWRPGRRHAIRGCFSQEILRVLHQWGFSSQALHEQSNWPKKQKTVTKTGAFVLVKPRTRVLGPTVAGFLRLTRSRTPEQRFFVATSTHFLVVRGRKIYDNLNPEGVFIREYRHRRYRITGAWEITT